MFVSWSSRSTSARARRCGAASQRRPRRTSSSRTPTSSTTPTSTRALLEPVLDGRGRRRLRLALPRAASRTASLYFWHCRQPVPDPALEHVHQPQPHRHGDLLQGLPPRGHPEHRSSRRTASASSRRSRPRSPSAVGGSTRSASPTPAGPTPRARRSAGATVCGPSTASCATRRRRTRRPHPRGPQHPQAEFDDSDAELGTTLDSLEDADNYADWIYELMSRTSAPRCSRSAPVTVS